MASLGMMTLIGSSLHFFMRRLLPAGIAKLLGFHPFGMLFLVLGCGVIAIFAIPALQRNDVAHKLISFFILRPRFLSRPKGRRKLFDDLCNRSCLP
jgi:hypothetical protein